MCVYIKWLHCTKRVALDMDAIFYVFNLFFFAPAHLEEFIRILEFIVGPGCGLTTSWNIRRRVLSF